MSANPVHYNPRHSGFCHETLLYKLELIQNYYKIIIIKNSANNLVGNSFIQDRFISLSYRSRGYAVRTNNNEETNNIKIVITISNVFVENMKPLRTENRSIVPYSAKKIRANLLLLYSTLKPETNSDSPSAKSKGARLHSATHERNQETRIGKARNSVLIQLHKEVKLNLERIITTQKINTAILISYLIVCDPARNAPNILYFLFDDQPLKVIG